jgi:CheY-like chemotaxis protein
MSGYDVCEAANGAEAMTAVRAAPFDIIITDIVMPDRDGIETIGDIRREYPHTPIIAISAPSNELYLESALGLGANRVFAKPLKLKDLVQAVQALLDAAKN